MKGRFSKDYGSAEKKVKNEFLFHQENLQISRFVQYANDSNTRHTLGG